MKKISIFTILTLLCLSTFSFKNQDETGIVVTESTFKVSALGEEVLYYGFSEGDQIIFDFEELDGKELKEVEILEYPSASKYLGYKTKKESGKIITVTKTAIYKFRFANSALSGRVCKVKIQRIPGSEATRNFNTSVYWNTIRDTSYTTEQERYLSKIDTAATVVTDQLIKVHSTSNENGNKAILSFTLPSRTIAWSYYIGVDESGINAYSSAASQIKNGSAGSISNRVSGYSPLAAVALGNESFIPHVNTGEDINYWITDSENMSAFKSGLSFMCYKKGKVFNDFQRMTSPITGSYYVCLSNDNVMTGVSVVVKVTAVTVTEQYSTRQVTRMQVSSRQEPYLKN